MSRIGARLNPYPLALQSASQLATGGRALRLMGELVWAAAAAA